MNEIDIKICEKLKELISKGKKLSSDLYSVERSRYSSYNENNNKYSEDGVLWKGSCINLLKLRFGGNSDYFKDFVYQLHTTQTSGEFYQENVARGVGVLKYILDALENNLTEDLFYEREILIFSSLLDQANEFLSKGIRDGAAIYGRIVLEITIREYAIKNDIGEDSFENLIVNLRKASLIHQPFETALRANYKIGSLAVHGKEEFKEISNQEIKEFLSFIRDKVITLR